MQDIADINNAFNHKPFNATSNQHKSFLKNYYDKVHQLKAQHSYLDFTKELDYLKQINASYPLGCKTLYDNRVLNMLNLQIHFVNIFK